MDIHQYANLIVVDESEIRPVGADPLENAIIVKLPNAARGVICHGNIKDAMYENFQVDIDFGDICQYGGDYFVVLDSMATKLSVLGKGYINVAGFSLPFMPWSREYGSACIPAQSQFDNHYARPDESAITSANEELTIEITGLPPHLCCGFIIERLLTSMCSVRTVTLVAANLTYFASIYGSESAVPHIAHIGVKKRNVLGEFINIWPVWYETRTADMHAYPQALPSSSVSEEQRG